MFCTNCGKEIPSGQNGIPVRFCPYCGGKVISLPPETSAAEAAEETVAAAAETVSAAETAAAAAAEEVQAAAEELQTAAEEVAVENVGSAEALAAAAAEEVQTSAEKIQADAEDAQTAAEEVVVETVAAAAEIPAADAPAEEPADYKDAAENLTETQPEPETPKKKSKAPIIALIAVLVLAAAGYFIYQNLPSTKVSKLMKEASSFIASAEFDEAVQKYDEALAIAPDNTEIKAAKADAFIAKAENYFAGDDYNNAILTYYDALITVEGLGDGTEENASKRVSEDLSSMAASMLEKGSFSKALDILNEKNKMFSSETEATASEILSVYKAWADKVMESGDPKKASELAGIIDDVRNKEELASVKSELLKTSIMLTNMKYRAQLAEVGKTLKTYIDAGDADGACNELYDTMLKRFSDNSNIINWVTMRQDELPFIADIDANTKIGIYSASERFVIYIGGYDASGKRSGEGAWLTCLGTPTSDYREYCAFGPWKNDLPNGQFTIRNFNKKSTDDGSTKITKVNVVNGLYDGEAEYAADNGVTYRPTFENGHPVIIEDYDMNGTTYHIAAYGDDEISFYHFTKGSDAIEAIFGFDGQ